MSDEQLDVLGAGHAWHLSCLLCLWRQEPGGRTRALLQDVLSGESRSSPSMESLLAYLPARPAPIAERAEIPRTE